MNFPPSLCIVLFLVFLVPSDSLVSTEGHRVVTRFSSTRTAITSLSSVKEVSADDQFVELPRLNVWMSMFSVPATTQTIQQQTATASESNVSPRISYDVLRFPELDESSSELSNLPSLPDVGAWRAAVKTGGITLPPSLEAYLSGSVDLQPEHEDQVNKIWTNLKKRASLTNLSDADKARVIAALKIAYVALYGKTTLRSLEVAVNRAQGTASVLGDMRADVNVVIAGILHDVFDQIKVEVGAARIRSEIISRVGNEVIQLVEKYSRLPKFMTGAAEYTPLQAENQIQMLVTLTEDYNALRIRIADRLHAMRVLRSLPIEASERVKLAEEALHVYAPLAHKMGLIRIKGELEDLAFRTLDPEMFQKTRYTQIAANKAFHDAAETIDSLVSHDEFLAKHKTSYKLSYRIKGKYQLYLKMKRKNLNSLNEVRDALGLRLIIQTPKLKDETDEVHQQRGNELCYHLIEKLRNMNGWQPADRGFKDYIKNKKANGYQSLHQYIRNIALGTNVEVQVRTLKMHTEAELGEAAHWYYKDQVYRPEVANSKLYRLAWRSPQQVHSSSTVELMSLARHQLLTSRVFVYLHDRSTVLNLRSDSTALDAAFSIHSDVGLSTATIEVNGKRVAMNRILKNGDVIRVGRAEANSVTAVPSWLHLTKTPHAHSILRKYFRDNHRDNLVCHGCLQLAATISLSSLLTTGKYSIKNKNLKLTKLVSLIHGRSGYKDISNFLLALASSSKNSTRLMLSNLFGVQPDELTIPSIPASITWAKTEASQQWSDNEYIRDMQIDLLRNILPQLGLPLAEKRWCEILKIPYVRPSSLLTSSSSTRLPFVTRHSKQRSNSPSSSTSTSIPLFRVLPLHEKSHIARAGYPFSLEASSLPLPLLRLAKQNYASRVKEQERRFRSVYVRPVVSTTSSTTRSGATSSGGSIDNGDNDNNNNSMSPVIDTSKLLLCKNNINLVNEAHNQCVGV